MSNRARLNADRFVFGMLCAILISASGQEARQETILSPPQLLDNLATKKYTGRRIDLVSSGAGLQEVMAKLEKAGGMRLELNTAIDDRVTYRLIDIPWDEALAMVLTDHSLHISPNLEGPGEIHTVPLQTPFSNRRRARSHLSRDNRCASIPPAPRPPAACGFQESPCPSRRRGGGQEQAHPSPEK
jgi:hypothetical protein